MNKRQRTPGNRKRIDRMPQLPPMRCDKGCDQCCGMAPASPKEYTSIQAYTRDNGISPLRQGKACPFFQHGKCAVYPVRPAICRLFGHVAGMECPRGYSTFIPRQQELAIQRWMAQRTRPENYRVLHEMAGYSQPKIMEIFLSDTKETAKPGDPHQKQRRK